MSHEPSLAEKDNPKVLIIFVTTVLSVIAVVTIVVGVLQFEAFTMKDEVDKMEMGRIDPALTKLRDYEKHALASYQWMDQSKQVVRIPVDRAVQLTLHDWKDRPAGTVANPVGGPAPEPAVAPAPVAPAPAVPAPAPAPKPKAGVIAPKSKVK